MPLWTMSTVKLSPHVCPVCAIQSEWVMLQWNTNEAEGDVVGTAECRHFVEQYDQTPMMPYGTRAIPSNQVESFRVQWYEVTKTVLPGV